MADSAGFLQHMNAMLLLVFWLSLPALGVAAGVGLLVGLLQAVTQVQDQSLPQTVKLVAVLLTLMVAAPALATTNPASAPSSTRSRGWLRRADSSAALSDPIAMIEPSRPYSVGPLWKACVAISAVVIWKFMPNVPRTKTRPMSSMRSGRLRT